MIALRRFEAAGTCPAGIKKERLQDNYTCIHSTILTLEMLVT